MRICIVSISDQLGGAEQLLFRVANYYSKSKDNSVSVFFLKNKTTTYWEEELGSETKIVYLNNNIFQLIKAVKKEQFQKTYTSHLIINAFLGILRTFCILKTEKLIVRESTQVFGRYSGIKLFQYKMAYFLGYKNIDLVVCQTEKMKQALKKNVSYLFKRTKVGVIPNPFDFPNEELVNQEINIPENTIVSAGRLITLKGFDILIQAFQKLRESEPNGNYKLCILGDGAEKENLTILMKNLNLQEHILLLGHIKNVYPYFKKAKLCVVSSIMEGFPNVLLQMMSQNEKVVSTLCAGGIDEIQGLLTCPPNDLESLYRSMQNCIKAETTTNRALFDEELKKRAINSFIKKIDNEAIN